MSVETRTVEVGPIYNQKNAEEVAEKYIAEHKGCKWTGKWFTTVPNKMSVIEVRCCCFCVCVVKLDSVQQASFCCTGLANLVKGQTCIIYVLKHNLHEK